MKVVWSPLALKRASEAVDAIAADRPAAARAWLEELLTRVDALKRFPEIGRIVPEIGKPEYRQILHDPYRIVYRVDRRQIVMLTVRHCRRAWDEAEVPPEN